MQKWRIWELEEPKEDAMVFTFAVKFFVHTIHFLSLGGHSALRFIYLRVSNSIIDLVNSTQLS